MRPVLALGPMLLMQGLSVNRRRPDLDALAAETRPERFVWKVLPHAARSFAASIVVLPQEQARAAAVAYLYCRMLDTYEDLYPDPEQRSAELRRFAARFDSDSLPAPNTIADRLARNDRDRVHLLLVDRCGHVDAVFRTLDRGFGRGSASSSIRWRRGWSGRPTPSPARAVCSPTRISWPATAAT